MKRFGPILLAVLATAVVHAQTHTVVTYEGAWSSTPTYVKSAVVTEAGSTYVSVQSGNINHDPAADTGHTWWAPLPGGTTFNGGTVANPITLPADPAQNLQAATKQYVDAHTSPVTINGKTGTNLALAASDVNAASASQAGSPFAKVANSLIDANHFFFADGTDGWCAGEIYCSSPVQMYGADTLFTMLGYPGHFTSSQVLNVVNKFIAAKNGNGDFPETVKADGTAGQYYSGADLHQAHVTGDGWITVPLLLNLYWQKTGDLTPYSANVAAIKTALARIPRNPTNHLITINTGDEYVACVGFLEQPRYTGDNACASIFYAQDVKVLAAMATAAGDTTNASFFNAEYSNVEPNIATVFTDATSHMLNGATGQMSQIEVTSSVLATYFGFVSSTQAGQISDYLNTNYSSLTYDGFVLQFAAPCATTGMIPSGGGTPYTAWVDGSHYQCGYWGFLSGWFAQALAKNHPAQAAAFVQSYLANPNPGQEFYNRDQTVTGGESNALLTSPQGIRWASELYPGSTAPTTGMCVLDGFGRCTNYVPANAYAPGTTAVSLDFLQNTTISASLSSFQTISPVWLTGLQPGGHAMRPIGAGSSPSNMAYYGFHYAGNGSANNYGTVGLYGADDVGTWWPDGSFRFAQPRLISAVLTCSASLGGQFNYVHANSSTKDVVQVCAQDAGGTYAWRSLY